MSIINQMLLKLEKRHGGRFASLPEGVRAVATASKAARRPLALGVLLAVLALLGGYFGWTWWQNKAKPTKSVAVSGKIPGSVPRQNVTAPAPPTPLVEKKIQPLEVQKLPEELEKPEKQKNIAPSAPKKKAAPSEMTEAVVVSGLSDTARTLAIAPSRESVVKPPQKPVSREIAAVPEIAMKSVSSQQQALFHYQKALSWLQQGRVSEARNGLEEALRLDARHLAARQALAALMVEQKQYHQAELISLWHWRDCILNAAILRRLSIRCIKACRMLLIMPAFRHSWPLCCNVRSSIKKRSNTTKRHCV